VSISFSPEAEVDFASVMECLADRNRTAAAELGRRIFAVLDKLARGDFEGPQQILRAGDVVRSWPVPPIRIYYQRRAEGLWVVRLYHQAQRPSPAEHPR
jgi:plasmid stabilization system protein ParE